MLKSFLELYWFLIERAAWVLQQNLNAAGKWSVDDARSPPKEAILYTGWNPEAAVLPLAGILILFFFLICLFVILASYVLGRKKGSALALTLILAPCLFRSLNLWPTIYPTPQEFAIGEAGNIGDPLGTSVLIGLTAILGWSLTIIVVDTFCLRRRSWDLLEHFWLALGLVAIIFFVSDVNVSKHDGEKADAERDTQKASAYLLKQVDVYINWCHETSSLGLASCVWASRSHQVLLDASFRNPPLDFKLSSVPLIYGWFGLPADPQQKLTIRTEIARYNRLMCPITHIAAGIDHLEPSLHCEETPVNLIGPRPEPLYGKLDAYMCFQPLALATECLLPKLVASYRNSLVFANRFETDHRQKNYRWAYYLFFSSILGMKVAGSTTKFMALDERSPEETRRIFRAGARLARTSFSIVRSLTFGFARLLRQLGKWRL